MRSSVGVRFALIAQSFTIVVELIAIALVRAPFSLIGSSVNGLGARTCATIAAPDGPLVVCSPAGWALSAAWVVAGLLLAYAALVLRLPLVRHRELVGTLAFFSLLVTGLSMVGRGIISVDADLGLHRLLAIPSTLLFGLSMALTAVALRGHIAKATVWVWLGALASICGAAAMFTSGFGLTGLLERFALWVPALWFAMLGENWQVWVRSERQRRQRHTGRHRPVGA